MGPVVAGPDPLDMGDMPDPTTYDTTVFSPESERLSYLACNKDNEEQLEYLHRRVGRNQEVCVRRLLPEDCDTLGLNSDLNRFLEIKVLCVAICGS